MPRRNWNGKEPFRGGEFYESDPRHPKMSKKLEKTNQFGRFFKFFGLTLFMNNQELQGDCPFPDCENPTDHFYANPGTGQWNCKRCGRQGNTYDFIRSFHPVLLEGTTDKRYDKLARKRPGIDSDTLKTWQLAYNPLNGHWVLPAFGNKGLIQNLYSYGEFTDHKTGNVSLEVRSAPTMNQIPYGLTFVTEDKTLPVYTLEGHWDTLAFYQILRDIGKLDAYDFFGFPGASTYCKTYMSILEGREVRSFFDADDAGIRGGLGLVNLMATEEILPKKFFLAEWYDGTEQGYDVRDVAAHFENSHKSFKYLNELLHKTKVEVGKTKNEGYNPSVEPKECTSWAQLEETVGETLTLSQPFSEAFALGIANIIVRNMTSPMSWDYFVGASGCGKSTLLSLLGACYPQCFTTPYFTQIFSGFGGKGDSSLLTQFNGKTVIIPDMTSLLAAPPTQTTQLFGQLRTLYEDQGKILYGNRQFNDATDIKFNLLMGTTRAIRRFNMTEFGERTLQYEMDTTWSDDCHLIPLSNDVKDAKDDQAIDNVLDGMIETDEMMTNFHKFIPEKCITWGYIDHVLNALQDRDYVRTVVQQCGRPEFKRTISQMGQWAAAASSHVDRSGKERDITYRGQRQSPTRINTQLMTKAVGLCIAYGIEEPDQRVHNIIRKVALDTGYSFGEEVMLYLAHHPKSRRNQIASGINLSSTKTHSLLEDLLELEIIQVQHKKSSDPGRPLNLYSLNDDIVDMAKVMGAVSKEDDDEGKRKTRLSSSTPKLKRIKRD